MGSWLVHSKEIKEMKQLAKHHVKIGYASAAITNVVCDEEAVLENAVITCLPFVVIF